MGYEDDQRVYGLVGVDCFGMPHVLGVTTEDGGVRSFRSLENYQEEALSVDEPGELSLAFIEDMMKSHPDKLEELGEKLLHREAFR